MLGMCFGNLRFWEAAYGPDMYGAVQNKGLRLLVFIAGMSG